jgi:transcriptional regulator with XRE-family HTH domain
MQVASKKFPERLRSLMQPGENQTQFATRIGIGQGQLNNYLTNKFIPRRDVGDRIAAALGISPAWLLYGEGSPHPGEGDKLRRLGLRVDRNLGDRDWLEAAFTCLDHLPLSGQERARMKQIIEGLAQDPARIEEVYNYLQWLAYRDERKK